MRSLRESLEDDFGTVARSLLGRASVSAEAEMGAPFDPRVLDSIDLARHGEGLIGLENLCSNIDDYEVALTATEREALLRFADAWQLGDRYRRIVGLSDHR